jgi:hypothetical protein
MLAERADSTTAYWIRDSEDLINAVSLVDTSIYDVSWQPTHGICQSIVLLLDRIVSIESREVPGAALTLGLSVEGDFAVLVHTQADTGGVVWAASDGDNALQLADFTARVLETLSRKAT